MRSVFPTRVPALFFAGVLLLFIAGCASEDHEAAGPVGPGRFHHPPPTPLAGQETYFDGNLGVAITVGGLEGIGNGPGGGEGGEKGSGGGGRRRGGGMGGGGRRHEGGYGESSNGERPEGGPPLHGSMEAPQMIHLKFTNHGTEKVVVNIADFVSPFGDFAVQPETLTLAPGQTVETEPMSSRLAGSLNEADATLVLQVSGKTEKKVVVLRAVTPALPAEPAPPPAK